MEDELGARLFDRHGRGMVITEAGREALRHAKRVLAETEELRASVSGPGAELAGHVAVGLPPTLADMVSVPLVAAFTANHPRVRLQLVAAYTGYLLDSLNRGEIDLAVLYDPRATGSLRIRPLMQEALFLIARAMPASPPGSRCRSGRWRPSACSCRAPATACATWCSERPRRPGSRSISGSRSTATRR